MFGTPKNFNEIDEEGSIRGEKFRRVETAEVIWADYARISTDFGSVIAEYYRKDFPTRSEIDHFLTRYGAIISESQISSDIINSKIHFSEEIILADRPPLYGRAAVVDFSGNGGDKLLQGGLLDLKGVGVAKDKQPLPSFHSTGLLTLIEALKEVVMQKCVEEVCSYLNVNVRGVALYAIIRLGFDLTYQNTIFPQSKQEPVAVLVRAAHHRPKGNTQVFPRNHVKHRSKLKIELLLRCFGLTSASEGGRLTITSGQDGREAMGYINGYKVKNVSDDAFRELMGKAHGGWPNTFDVVNIQLTRNVRFRPLEAELVDFGTYNAVDFLFCHPLIDWASGCDVPWCEVIDVNHRWWVQPDPILSRSFRLLAAQETPVDLWAWRGFTPRPRESGLSIFCTAITNLVIERNLSAYGVIRRLNSFVNAATSSLHSPSFFGPSTFKEWESRLVEDSRDYVLTRSQY